MGFIGGLVSGVVRAAVDTVKAPFNIVGDTIGGAFKGLFSWKTLLGAGLGFLVGGPFGAAIGAGIAGPGLGALGGAAHGTMESFGQITGDLMSGFGMGPQAQVGQQPPPDPSLSWNYNQAMGVPPPRYP